MGLGNTDGMMAVTNPPKKAKTKPQGHSLVRSDPSDIREKLAHGIASNVRKAKVMLTRDEVLDRLEIHGDLDKIAEFIKLWQRLEPMYAARADKHEDEFSMPIPYKQTIYVMSAQRADPLDASAVHGLKSGSFTLEEKCVSRMATALKLTHSDSNKPLTAPPAGYIAIDDLPSQPNRSEADVKRNRPLFMAALINRVGQELKQDRACRGEGEVTVLAGKVREEVPLRYCRLQMGINGRYRYFVYLGTEAKEQQTSLQNLDKAVEHFITQDVFAPFHYLRPEFKRWSAPAAQVEPTHAR